MATAIAGRLLGGDRRPAGRVALLFADPVSAIGSMLGVLKAGHAYVILDAHDPATRLRFIVNDCEPFALLTDDAHFRQACSLAPADCEIIPLPTLRPDAPGCLLPVVPPNAIAYLFYTSGSTGRPKGVCQTHRNLQHFVRCYTEALRITEADRLSQLFSLTFSASNMHIYSGLLSGATICPYDTRTSGIAPLPDWLDSHRVTVVHTVPTVFRRITKGLDPQRRFEHLRAVDVGGEALFASDLPQFRQHLAADAILVNHLGATEASVIAQYTVDRSMTCAESRVVPVGWSPAGVHVTIRRPDGTAAAEGEWGEIAVSSSYLSPGYWRRPRLNAAAFSDDPHRPGCRVFRSGDMGRMNSAHGLEFLGRRGTRVKLRGQSVDLNEVEAGLRRCKRVSNVAVLATTSSEQHEADRLVAYVVTDVDADQDPGRLRRELASHLPAYMLPTAFHFLEALPQTATGKIDRRALARIKVPPAVQRPGSERPRNETEVKIAAIFEQVLGFSPVGRDDDFFLCGGDSLSVMELSVHLVNLFGSNVPGVFQDTTVSGLAAAIQRNAERPPEDQRLMPVLLPQRTEGTPPILFLIHGRRGQAHVGPRILELIGPAQPLYVFQARGVDGIQEPHQTIDAMAEDYVSAVRSVQSRGPYFFGGLCSGGFVAVKMAQILRALGEQVGPLLLIDPPVPPFTKEAAAKNLRILDSGLRTLLRSGNIDFDFNDPKRKKGALRVAKCIERALIMDRPIPYEGLVYLLTSKEKLTADGWKNLEKLKSRFSGPVECFEVGERHIEILDTHNEDFARCLTQCVKSARESMEAARGAA